MDPIELKLTGLSEEQIPQIAELEKQCFSDPWSEASLRSELSSPVSVWVVAEQQGAVVGYAGAHLVEGDADILNVAASPLLRRQGIGRTVLTALLRELRQRNAASVILEVRESNLPALGLYASLGFRQVGLRPGYYEKPRENALLLRAAL